jgi:hypothetical protein
MLSYCFSLAAAVFSFDFFVLCCGAFNVKCHVLGYFAIVQCSSHIIAYSIAFSPGELHIFHVTVLVFRLQPPTSRECIWDTMK